MNEKKICACVGARTRDTQKSKEHYTSTLTPLQQRIAELRDIGYSDREISAICGIPYKVVALEMEGAKRSILEVYIGDAPRAA